VQHVISNKSDDEKNEKNEGGSINVDVTEDNDSRDFTECYMSRETIDHINIKVIINLTILKIMS
jgi:hypothetical protein